MQAQVRFLIYQVFSLLKKTSKQKASTKEFTRAVIDNLNEKVVFCKESIDVNAKDEYDQTPLHSAAWEGHTVKENLSNVYQFHEILHCKKSLQDVRYLY